MKTKKNIISRVGFFTLLILCFNTTVFGKDKIYVNKSELTCDAIKAHIVTKCDDLDLEGAPQCGEQTLSLVDLKTGHKILTSSYGKPYDKKFEGAGTANAWQCVKGKKEFYIVMWYSSGGNCEECDWQGILDMKGNRITTDMNKKKRANFNRKWNTLGLPVLGPNDFTEIPLRKIAE